LRGCGRRGSEDKSRGQPCCVAWGIPTKRWMGKPISSRASGMSILLAEASGPLQAGLLLAAPLLLGLLSAWRRGSAGEAMKPRAQDAAGGRSVSAKAARDAEEELRLLAVTRDVLLSAMTMVRRAHAEKRITDKELETLTRKHSEDLQRFNEEITRRELLVKLYELEGVRERITGVLVKKVEELSQTIDQIRSSLGVEPRFGEPTTTPIPLGQPTVEAERVYAPKQLEAPGNPGPAEGEPGPTEEAAKAKEPGAGHRPAEKSTPATRIGRGASGGESASRIEDEISRIKASVARTLRELEEMERRGGRV